jgi:hypothetical protein
MTNYWKIRALELQARAAQDACAAALERFYAEMKAAGFDPAKPHHYDDKTETITEIKPAEMKTDGNATRPR